MPRMVTLAKQCQKHKTFIKQVRGFGRVIASYCPECSREKEQEDLRREQEERRERKQQQIREELRLKVGRNWDFPLEALGMSKEQTNIFQRAAEGFLLPGNQLPSNQLPGKGLTGKNHHKMKRYVNGVFYRKWIIRSFQRAKQSLRMKR